MNKVFSWRIYGSSYYCRQWMPQTFLCNWSSTIALIKFYFIIVISSVINLFSQLLYMLLYMFRMWALKGKLATRHFSTAMNQRFALCSCFWLKSCPERVQRLLTSLQVRLTTDFFIYVFGICLLLILYSAWNEDSPYLFWTPVKQQTSIWWRMLDFSNYLVHFYPAPFLNSALKVG